MRCKYCGRWSGFFENEHLDCSQAGKSVAPQETTKKSSRRIGNWPLFLAFCVIVTFTAFSGLQETVKILLIAATITLYAALPRMQRLLHQFVLTLELKGKYRSALALDKILFRIGIYAKSLAGWIYLEAGRYEEGLLFFQPLAFDEDGTPRHSTPEFLFYAIFLSRKEAYADAQLVLESAVNFVQDVGDAHIALADCLLAQNEDAARACGLVESVLRFREESASEQPFALASAVAMHAFALAACGAQEQAKSRLNLAFADSASFSKHDLAALHVVAGYTWRALGNPEKALKAFQTSLTLHPFGDIALRVRKAMVRKL